MPPGFYSSLQAGKVTANSSEQQMQMAENSKGKPKVKGKGSKGSKKSTKSETEDKIAELDKESDLVEMELRDIEQKDCHSKHLHALALQGQVEFIEDFQVPDELEKEEVWQKTNEEHKKEESIIQVRFERLERKKQLMEIKHKLRQQRLQLMKEEKQLELMEKQRQVDLGAQWLEIQKAEYKVQQNWDQQQREMEEFEKSKRLQGWVHEAAVHVSRGDVASVKSKEHKPEKVGSGKRSTKMFESNAMKADIKTSGGQPQEKVVTGPLAGVKHLGRMGLLPAYGVTSNKEPSISQLPNQDRGMGWSMGMGTMPKEIPMRDPWEQLSCTGEGGKTNPNLMHGIMVDTPWGAGAPGDRGDKVKVKSGKFAKSNQDLQREEKWPHLNVLRQYTKRTTFDQMEFEMFVAGETRIILSMMNRDQQRATGRLKVLCKVAHWFCRAKDWSSIRTIYEAIIESVEMGENDWTSPFESFEALVPPPPSVLVNIKRLQEDQAQKEKEKENKKKDMEGKKMELFWCKDYQKGVCMEPGPHMAQLKPDEKPVWVVHICATCWQKDKIKRTHAEGDQSCPNKKN